MSWGESTRHFIKGLKMHKYSVEKPWCTPIRTLNWLNGVLICILIRHCHLWLKLVPLFMSTLTTKCHTGWELYRQFILLTDIDRLMRDPTILFYCKADKTKKQKTMLWTFCWQLQCHCTVALKYYKYAEWIRGWSQPKSIFVSLQRTAHDCYHKLLFKCTFSQL